MKNLVRSLALVLALATPAIAQTVTAVTGQVLDVNGVPYAAGTVLPIFVNVSGGATPTITATGATLIPGSTPLPLNSTGSFTVGLVANGSITPASTTWKFLICSPPTMTFPDAGSTGSQCFTTAGITISGASQNITGNILAAAPPALLYASLSRSLGSYQGTSSVGITDTAFHALIAAAADPSIPANLSNITPRKIRCHGSGVYTNAAASLLNAAVQFCTVSGCGSGTVVAPAGGTITSTNQANTLTNGQWSLDVTATTDGTNGSSGTYMVKAIACFNLGAATTAAQSCFQDPATAVSAAIDQTSQEFLNPAFKFTTSNAGNSATVHEWDCKQDN